MMTISVTSNIPEPDTGATRTAAIKSGFPSLTVKSKKSLFEVRKAVKSTESVFGKLKMWYNIF